MTQNIETRTEVAVKQYEGAAKSIDEIAHADKDVSTNVGPRKSFPKISREWDEESQRLQKNWGDESQRLQTEFQNDSAVIREGWLAERNDLSIKALGVKLWGAGQAETNLNQQRRWTDNHTYLPKSVPAVMGASGPDENWVPYTANKADTLQDVFGRKPLDMLPGLVLLPDTDNNYPKLSAYGKIWEIDDGDQQLIVADFSETVDGLHITFQDGSQRLGGHVSAASKSLLLKKANSRPLNVASVHDLRNIRDLSDGTVVNLLGYDNPGDGGEGEFVYAKDNNEPDNGGNVIAPAVMSGRWLRPRRNYTCAEFGAIGNTDVSGRIDNPNFTKGKDCTQALRNAFEEMGAVQEGLSAKRGNRMKLELPRGNYYVSDPVVASKLINFEIVGTGRIVTDLPIIPLTLKDCMMFMVRSLSVHNLTKEEGAGCIGLDNTYIGKFLSGFYSGGHTIFTGMKHNSVNWDNVSMRYSRNGYVGHNGAHHTVNNFTNGTSVESCERGLVFDNDTIYHGVWDVESCYFEHCQKAIVTKNRHVGTIESSYFALSAPDYIGVSCEGTNPSQDLQISRSKFNNNTEGNNQRVFALKAPNGFTPKYEFLTRIGENIEIDAPTAINMQAGRRQLIRNWDFFDDLVHWTVSAPGETQFEPSLSNYPGKSINTSQFVSQTFGCMPNACIDVDFWAATNGSEASALIEFRDSLGTVVATFGTSSSEPKNVNVFFNTGNNTSLTVYLKRGRFSDVRIEDVTHK